MPASSGAASLTTQTLRLRQRSRRGVVMSPRSLIKPTAGTTAALLLVTGAGLLAGCGTQTRSDAAGGTSVVAVQAASQNRHLQQPVQTKEADWKPVADALGRTG